MTRAVPYLVPVFPLPRVVFFPRVALSLHVFEPRYLTMLSEVLDGRGRIAMALADLGEEGPEEEHWEIRRVVTVGSVHGYERREDGTCDVTLIGDERARIDEWVEGKAFRQARVLRLPVEIPPSAVRRDALRAQLRTDLKKIFEGRGPAKDLKKLLELFARDPDLSFLVDFLAYHFLEAPLEKQGLLEEAQVERRATALRQLLEQRGLV